MATSNTIPVQVTVRLRNARMIEARKRFGYSQVHLAAIAGVSLSLIMRLEKFDLAESLLEYYNGDTFAVLADILELEVDDIVPPSMCGHSIAHTVRTVEDVEADKLLTMAGPQQRYILPSPSDIAERNDYAQVIQKLITTLSFREREILKLRFGIGTGCEHSYEELGRTFKVSRSRIQQIEKKAMTKLGNRIERHEANSSRKDTTHEVINELLEEWEDACE